MTRRLGAAAVLVAALALAAPALADQAKTVTATGNSQEKVTPTNRNSNASISAAVDRARKAGIRSALADAREYALDYARAAGLTLGTVISVSDAQSNGGGFYGPGVFGSFGPDQFCARVTQPVFKTVGGKRKRVGVKHVPRCFVPQFEVTTLTVTYAAT